MTKTTSLAPASTSGGSAERPGSALESPGSSPAPSNGGGAPVATGAAMPVWLREHRWRQTASAVYLSLPVRGLRVTPANIFCTDRYLKVGRPRASRGLLLCRVAALGCVGPVACPWFIAVFKSAGLILHGSGAVKFVIFYNI